MPFGWVGSCDIKREAMEKAIAKGGSPMPFGWVGSCDEIRKHTKSVLHPRRSPMPFGWVGSCDSGKEKQRCFPREASPMPFGWVGSCDEMSDAEMRELEKVVSNAFRLGGEL